jgi:hypothetical protein
MRKVRVTSRRRKIDPHNGTAATSISVRAANGDSNGRINISQSLSGFDHSVLGCSTGQSTASAVVLEQL